jgi:hypothetical protein
MDLSRLIDSRGAVSYAKYSTHLYPREVIIPPHIEILVENMHKCRRTQMPGTFAFVHNFWQSI